MWRFKSDLPIDLPVRLSVPKRNPIAKQCKVSHAPFGDAERTSQLNTIANILRCKPNRPFYGNQTSPGEQSSDTPGDIKTLAIWTIKSDLHTPTPERLFASNLMYFVAKCFCMNHIPLEKMCRFGRSADSPFTNSICEAVERFIQKLTTTAMVMHYNHLSFPGVTIHNFERFARKMALRMIVLGFKAHDFLEFCTLICLIAVVCRKRGIVSAPNSATVIIDDVVQWFRSTGDWPEKAWEDLQREAVHFEIGS